MLINVFVPGFLALDFYLAEFLVSKSHLIPALSTTGQRSKNTARFKITC